MYLSSSFSSSLSLMHYHHHLHCCHYLFYLKIQALIDACFLFGSAFSVFAAAALCFQLFFTGCVHFCLGHMPPINLRRGLLGGLFIGILNILSAGMGVRGIGDEIGMSLMSHNNKASSCLAHSLIAGTARPFVPSNLLTLTWKSSFCTHDICSTTQ